MFAKIINSKTYFNSRKALLKVMLKKLNKLHMFIDDVYVKNFKSNALYILYILFLLYFQIKLRFCVHLNTFRDKHSIQF